MHNNYYILSVCLSVHVTLLSSVTGEVAGRASSTRDVILSKGEKIYHLITDDHVPKYHKVRLKTYPKSFTGKEFIKWLMLRNEVENADQGVILGQALLENGVIHHGE